MTTTATVGYGFTFPYDCETCSIFRQLTDQNFHTEAEEYQECGSCEIIEYYDWLTLIEIDYRVFIVYPEEISIMSTDNIVEYIMSNSNNILINKMNLLCSSLGIIPRWFVTYH